MSDSISIATTIRIGNRLGEGEGMKGRQAGHCSMAMLGGFSLCYACLTWALRDVTPILYTEDPEVLELSASAIRIFAVYLVRRQPTNSNASSPNPPAPPPLI